MIQKTTAAIETALACLLGDAKRDETRAAVMAQHDFSAERADEIVTLAKHQILTGLRLGNPDAFDTEGKLIFRKDTS